MLNDSQKKEYMAVMHEYSNIRSQIEQLLFPQLVDSDTKKPSTVDAGNLPTESVANLDNSMAGPSTQIPNNRGGNTINADLNDNSSGGGKPTNSDDEALAQLRAKLNI